MGPENAWGAMKSQKVYKMKHPSAGAVSAHPPHSILGEYSKFKLRDWGK